MSDLMRAIEFREQQMDKKFIEQREHEADVLVRTIVEEQDGKAADLGEFVFAVHGILRSKPATDEASAQVLETYQSIEQFFGATNQPVARYSHERHTRPDTVTVPKWIGQIAADPVLHVDPARGMSRPVRGSIFLTAKNVHTSKNMLETSPDFRADVGDFNDPRSFEVVDAIRAELTRGGRDYSYLGERVVQVYTPCDLGAYAVGWSEIMNRFDDFDRPNRDTLRFMARVAATMQDFGIENYSRWDAIIGETRTAS